MGFLILLGWAPGGAVVEAGVKVEAAAGEAGLLTDALCFCSTRLEGYEAAPSEEHLQQLPFTVPHPHIPVILG